MLTLGAWSPRAAESRTAKDTRLTRNATRVGVAQAAAPELRHRPVAPATPPPYVPTSFPAAWYDDGTGTTRWYDGLRWTSHTR